MDGWMDGSFCGHKIFLNVICRLLLHQLSPCARSRASRYEGGDDWRFFQDWESKRVREQ